MTDANITSNSSQIASGDKATEYIAIASVIIYSVTFVLGTLGNGLVIYVTGFRMKATVNSVWFLNLALADFLFMAFLVVHIINISQQYHWHLGAIMCKFNNFVGVVSMFASIFLLMTISLDRCLSIWVVVWAQNKRTVRKAQLISAVIWICAMVCSIPYAIFRETMQHGVKIYCYTSSTAVWGLTIFRFVMGFLIPFLVICASYVAIGVRAKRLHRTKRQRSNRIMFSVVFAFFICWLPFHVMHYIDFKSRTHKDLWPIVKYGHFIAVCLAFMNSCLNPILYVFMCKDFQKKLKQSICTVLESALAEDYLSFMSSRSFTSQLSRISRKSDTVEPLKDTATSLQFTGCKEVTIDERDTLSTE